MDPEEVGVAPLSPPRDFEQIVEKRAENREHLRGRNNVTSCRSPTREFDTKWIKNELQHKRHLEFLRRRSVSPDPRGPTPVRARRCPSKRKPSAKFRYHLTTESETNPPVNGRLLMKLTPNYGMESDDPSTSKWASLWSEPVTEAPSTFIPKEPNQQRLRGTEKRDYSINGQKISIKTFIRTEKIHQTEEFPLRTEEILHTEEFPLQTEKIHQTEEFPLRTEKIHQTEEFPLQTEKILQTEEFPLRTEKILQTEEFPLRTEKILQTEEFPLRTENILQTEGFPLRTENILQTEGFPLRTENILQTEEFPLRTEKIHQTEEFPLRTEKIHQTEEFPLQTEKILQTEEFPLRTEKILQTEEFPLRTEKIHQTEEFPLQTQRILQTEEFPLQTEKILQKKILRGAGVQTESGFVTVKESDVQRLADYLEEALWREEVVKKKLVALQESSSILLHSSNKIWTARCNEDLLRNQINALEAQLQVCLQKFPKDGLKRVVLQMEKQKVVYEEKALAALQKVTHEKTEALSKAETLQGALLTAKAEVLRWQSLYEELKLSSGQLKESRDLSTGQLQQLHSQLERSRAHEAELRHEVGSLLQEKRELQYNVGLLEEDNQVLIEAIQQLRDGSTESQDVTVQMSGPVEEAEPQQEVERDSQVEEQLRCTQDRLRLKEKECEELQTELDAIEQECQSSQARLTQCRDELRQLSHRRSSSSRRLCGSWWRVCVVLVLLLAAVGVAMLFLWHPPFREQVEDMYSDIETCIDDYLVEMASQHSGCFRPI